ncbi:Bdr family repetitive protein [Borrelia sp. RT1S]|uniref:Bdr family repetitive protein n=1 Tax=Borrelia sp. RT1S TaxID=2898580 RepID=UPI001E371958|nr:Bdr family repetitive protein [Borrelia sp. RT1S]UGQ17939.1 Bdr family repetitive protein [Borrelia sp. RT1S]
MNTSLVSREISAEDVRKEFESKGFSHAVIDFILIRNDNFHYQVLSERINSLEKNLEKNMNIKFDSVNERMDRIESNMDKRIEAAIRPLYWIFGFISTFTGGVFIALLTMIVRK